MKYFLLLSFFVNGATLAVFAQEPYSEIKQFSISAPFFVSRSPQKLSRYLTRNDSTEAQKVLHIYNWITHNIKYDIKNFQRLKPKSYTVHQTLRRRKGICTEYSYLFNTLCSNAGISSKEIAGYSRGLSFFEDDTFYQADHSWNGVKIDSIWYLVDATWGSGVAIQKKQLFKEVKFKWFKKPYINNKYKFSQKPNHKYFLAQPEELIKTHLPADPSWQMVEFPVSLNTFESNCWSGYQNKMDSTYQRAVGTSENIEILNNYELLFGHQYLSETAEKAHLFNPRNFSLLSESFLKQSSTPYMFNDKPTILIDHNNESIKRFRSAILNARKHQESINYEIQNKIVQFKNRSRTELYEPNNRQVKAVKSHLQSTEKIILKKTRYIESIQNKILKLKDNLNNDAYKVHNPGKYISLDDPDLIEEKIQEVNTTLSEFQNSSKFLQDGLINLILRKSIFQIKNNDLFDLLGNSIEKNTLLIIEGSQLTDLKNAMLQVDSLGKEIDEVNANLVGIEDSIMKIKRSLGKLQSSIFFQHQLKFQLLMEKCKLSPSENCEASVYHDSFGAIKYVVNQDLEIQEMLLKMEKNDIRYHWNINGFLYKHSELLTTNGKFITYYVNWRMAGMAFEEKKNIYQTYNIIRKSNMAITSLNTTNNRLKKNKNKRNNFF